MYPPGYIFFLTETYKNFSLKKDITKFIGANKPSKRRLSAEINKKFNIYISQAALIIRLRKLLKTYQSLKNILFKKKR